MSPKGGGQHSGLRPGQAEGQEGQAERERQGLPLRPHRQVFPGEGELLLPGAEHLLQYILKTWTLLVTLGKCRVTCHFWC